MRCTATPFLVKSFGMRNWEQDVTNNAAGTPNTPITNNITEGDTTCDLRAAGPCLRLSCFFGLCCFCGTSVLMK